MDIQLGRQAALLLAAFGIGALIGLWYDLLRPIRHSCGKTGAFFLDGLFCLAALALLFCFGLKAQNGRSGTWELLSSLMGFLVYLHCLSRIFLPFYAACLSAAKGSFTAIKKHVKKTTESEKFFFKKLIKCFIIKKEAGTECASPGRGSCTKETR